MKAALINHGYTKFLLPITEQNKHLLPYLTDLIPVDRDYSDKESNYVFKREPEQIEIIIVDNVKIKDKVTPVVPVPSPAPKTEDQPF